MKPLLSVFAFTLLIPACGPAEDGGSRVYSDVTDSVAVAAGLRPLHKGRLPAGVRREVRAYIGFGIVVTQQVIRIWHDKSGVHGWVGLWWPSDIGGLDSTFRPDCTDVRAGAGYKTCTVATPNIDWRAVLARLDRYRVARLPQQQQRPMVLDGVSLVIEHRDGARYNTYRYSNPGGDGEDPNETDARRILDMLARL